MFSRFKAGGRQRQQQRFLIFEEQRPPAAFFFLERCFVVFPEPSFDCLVQLRQRKNCSFLRAAVIHVETCLTVPSALGLSFGVRTRAGIMAVL